MSRDTTVIAFRQPEAIDDPLSEPAREGARRMLAQVLIAHDARRGRGHGGRSRSARIRLFVALAVNRLLAPMRAVFEPAEAVIGKASPPVADDPRLNTHFLGNRSVLRPSAASNTIRARLTSRCGALGARQRASSNLRIFGLSRTSLASGTIPVLNHDSPENKSGY